MTKKKSGAWEQVDLAIDVPKGGDPGKAVRQAAGGGCALVLALPLGAVVAALVTAHEAGWV